MRITLIIKNNAVYQYGADNALSEEICYLDLWVSSNLS